MKKAIVLLLLVTLSIFQYIRTSSIDQNPYLVTNYSRLHPVKVERVAKGEAEEQLIALVSAGQRSEGEGLENIDRRTAP